MLNVKGTLLNTVRRLGMGPVSEEVLYRFSQDKSPQNPWVKILPNHYQYKKPTWRTVERNGVTFRLDISDYMQWALYFGVQIEPRESLYKLAKPGFIVFDIGANIGETLLGLGKVAGPNGKIYGFEPSRKNYERCLENIRLNQVGNIQVTQVAVSDVCDELTLLNIFENNAGGAKIGSSSVSIEGAEKVSAITLDDFVRENGIEKLDLIKIDIEGFELRALKGALNTIQKFKPILFVELDDRLQEEQGASAKGLVSFIRSLGYNLQNAETGEPVTEESKLENVHLDIICQRS